LLYAHFRRHRCYRHPSGSRHRWRRRSSSSSSIHLFILSLSFLPTFSFALSGAP